MTGHLHPGRAAGPWRLDKWYADTLLPDGSLLVVYLGSLAAGPLVVSRVSADLFLPDGTHLTGGAKGRRPRLGEGSADLGAAGFDDKRLWWRTDGLWGELRFAVRRSPCELRCPLAAAGRRSLHWVVEVPDADVAGEVRWPGGSLAISGRGYRDRVWTDIPLWRIPICELRWGRAVAGEHAAVWVAIAAPDGPGVAAAWQDGHSAGGGFASPLTGLGRVLQEGPVIDLKALRFGPLRAPLGRLLHAPHQVKRISGTTIGGVAGQAVHEVVTWPR